MAFPSWHFLQKTNKWILLYYYETSGWLVFVRFFEEIEDTKKTFRNYPTFGGHKNQLNRPNYIHTVQELNVTSILFPGTK